MNQTNGLIVIVSWMTFVLSSAILSRKYLPEKKELSRKICHIGTGPVILLAWVFDIQATIAIPIALLVTICLIINNRLKFLSALEDINRESYGTIAYGLSITFLLIIYWSTNPAAVSAGVLVMAFGDGLAGLLGKGIKSPGWTIMKQNKSIIGTIVMAIASLMVLLLIRSISGVDINIESLILISAIATGLEQVGPYGIDNITVPIAVSLGWLLLKR